MTVEESTGNGIAVALEREPCRMGWTFGDSRYLEVTGHSNSPSDSSCRVG